MHLPASDANAIHKDRDQRYNRQSFPKYSLFFRYKLRQYEHDGADFHHEIPYTVMEERAATVINDPIYFKFAVVRHPWDRIVSGYRSKYINICRSDRKCLEVRSFSLDLRFSPFGFVLFSFGLWLMQEFLRVFVSRVIQRFDPSCRKSSLILSFQSFKESPYRFTSSCAKSHP
jgi:hypothetical protein